MDASHLDAERRRGRSGPSRADGIYSAKGGSIRFPGNTAGSEMKSSKTIVGVDTAKRVFQLYWVEPETGEEMNVRLSRTKFLRHVVNRVPCLVAMEACSGTQHWARQLQSFGHEVRILPARTVSPFVRGNKNDAHDARGIWMAVQQPGLRTVAVKTEEQQGVLALHRMREQLVKFRTAQINGHRGGGRHGRSASVPVRSRVRRLAGSGATPRRHRRARSDIGHQQTRGPLPAHHVGPWRSIGDHSHQGAFAVAVAAA